MLGGLVRNIKVYKWFLFKHEDILKWNCKAILAVVTGIILKLILPMVFVKQIEAFMGLGTLSVMRLRAARLFSLAHLQLLSCVAWTLQKVLFNLFLFYYQDLCLL